MELSLDMPGFNYISKDSGINPFVNALREKGLEVSNIKESI